MRKIKRRYIVHLLRNLDRLKIKKGGIGMFNGAAVSLLLEKHKVPKKTLYKLLDMSRTNLDNVILGKHVPNGKTIEGIADFFNIPIDDLFDRTIDMKNVSFEHYVNGNHNQVGDNSVFVGNGKENIALLKLEIGRLSQQIEDQVKLIEVLRDQLKDKEKLIQLLEKCPSGLP
ncbi:MAG: helix-turn-helix transcriptional regulator [Mediterranea sp.]|nr:helix-turn-helix transcriptional regulator [Mediterranea sp.]